MIIVHVHGVYVDQKSKMTTAVGPYDPLEDKCFKISSETPELPVFENKPGFSIACIVY